MKNSFEKALLAKKARLAKAAARSGGKSAAHSRATEAREQAKNAKILRSTREDKK